jgi:hypothetical protein
MMERAEQGTQTDDILLEDLLALLLSRQAW